MSKVCELVWIEGELVQQERDMTEEEEAELLIRKNAAPTLPLVLSPRQFRQSLTHFGFRSTVEAVIAGADQDTKDWYNHATEFFRNHPVVVKLAAGLGYTEEQVDFVWRYGASL